MRRRLDTTFRRPVGWGEFAEATSVLAQSAAWVNAHQAQLTEQVAVRHLLPRHYSNSGAESSAAGLRRLFERRSFSLSATRTAPTCCSALRVSIWTTKKT